MNSVIYKDEDDDTVMTVGVTHEGTRPNLTIAVRGDDSAVICLRDSDTRLLMQVLEDYLMEVEA